MPKRKHSAEVADSSSPFKQQVLQQAHPGPSRFSDVNKMELRSRTVTKNAVGGLGSVKTARFVEELLGRGVRMVIFDFDGVMYREHAGLGCNIEEQQGPHALEEGFFELALVLASRGISMAIVTNNDRKTIVPILISNWKFHQRKGRHADFETIAKSGLFRRVQCIDTQIKQKHIETVKHKGQQMPGFGLDARGLVAPQPVAKNGMIRLAIYDALRRGALSAADVAKDKGVGACCTLLIDDRQNNTDAFRRLGGHTYTPLPHEGLLKTFDLDRLHSPLADDCSASRMEERSSAIASSKLSDMDWWLAEWQQTPEGGGGLTPAV